VLAGTLRFVQGDERGRSGKRRCHDLGLPVEELEARVAFGYWFVGLAAVWTGFVVVGVHHTR
jgi:hypothetical protein